MEEKYSIELKITTSKGAEEFAMALNNLSGTEKEKILNAMITVAATVK